MMSLNPILYLIKQLRLPGIGVLAIAVLLSSALSVAQEEKNRSPQQEQKQEKKQESIQKAVPNLPKRQKELLSKELDGSAIVELTAAGENFIALWEPNRSGNPFGAVLIAHGEGQTADWPHTLHPLRTKIVTHGWVTLSISLPNPQEASIPKRANKKEKTKNEKAQTEKAPGGKVPSPQKSPEKIAQARLKAGFDYLHQQGQFNIIIVGHGISATRALYFTKSLPSDGSSGKPKTRGKNAKAIIQHPVRALILLNARNEIPNAPNFTTKLPELLNAIDLPILDLFFDNHYQDGTEVQQRIEAARYNQIKHYYPVKLLEPTSEIFEGENRMTRRVRGFLNKHAKGVEIK